MSFPNELRVIRRTFTSELIKEYDEVVIGAGAGRMHAAAWLVGAGKSAFIGVSRSV